MFAGDRTSLHVQKRLRNSLPDRLHFLRVSAQNTPARITAIRYTTARRTPCKIAQTHGTVNSTCFGEPAVSWLVFL